MAEILGRFLGNERGQSWTEYFTLLSIDSAVITSSHTFNEARRRENRLLNRYEDVLPYDRTLVKLIGAQVPYINANYVRFEPANRSYILTQGPLSNTMSHFWHMVWQEQCTAIIMLNRLVEKGRAKCFQYYPTECSCENIIFDGMTNEDTSTIALNDAGLSLELQSEVHYRSFVKRTIKLTNNNTNEARTVYHYNYTDWPDFGEPSCPKTFLDFLKLLRDDRVFDGSPVVHCSAGIGRSGTFVFVDIVLEMLASDDFESVTSINPSEILQNLRGQRIGLIQTPDQLRFCYLAILQAFAEPSLRINAHLIGDFVEYLASPDNMTYLGYPHKVKVLLSNNRSKWSGDVSSEQNFDPVKNDIEKTSLENGDLYIPAKPGAHHECVHEADVTKDDAISLNDTQGRASQPRDVNNRKSSPPISTDQINVSPLNSVSSQLPICQSKNENSTSIDTSMLD